MAKFATIVILYGMFSAARADVIDVPGDYPTIQEGIDASSDGDTVLVAKGTYFENIIFRDKNITVASEYILSGSTESIEGTVINGSTPVDPDTGSCVIINGGQDSTAVLAGFTLTGGVGTRWVDEHGAGTYTEGGGVLTQFSSPTIRNNQIIGNFAVNVPAGVTSGGGGGIRVGDGMPRILNNVIMNNEGLYGAGIVLNYTGGIVRNNIIANNRVYEAAGSSPTFGGGGLWAWEDYETAEKIVENNTIYGNSVEGSGGAFAGRGGGVWVGSTTVIIRNNIVWGNTQTTGGQIGTHLSTGDPIVTFTDVEGGYEGEGNIDLDPQFADTSFYLLTGSPCIDAGDSNMVYNDPENPSDPGFALWPARGGLRNDMGAYGGPGSQDLGLFLIVSVEDGESNIPGNFRVEQNYPNPFNPETRIVFEIPAGKAHAASLQVFDVLGRRIETLVDGKLSAGRSIVHWDASGMPSGVYFYRLIAGEFSQTKRMVLLR